MAITESIEYQDAHGHYEGMLVYPENTSGKLPCVLVFPTVWGRASMEERAAAELADRGYVAMIVDIYGKGFDSSTQEAAFGRMADYNADRSFLLSRLQLVYETAKQLPQVDDNKIAGIGYCFGGKCVLDLARSGLKFSGGATFHGVLNPPEFGEDQKIVTPLLVLHGWDDPLATPEDVVALSQELTQKGADWELISYGHTAHSFMKPSANDPEGGSVYNAEVAEKAWKRVLEFLADQFKS